MRIGVIGLGRMGRNHTRVLNELGVLAAVCDTDPMALAGYPSITWMQPGDCTPFRYSDYHKMLKEKQLDAAVIAVPTSFHHEIGMAVIDAGISVLIEKPLAATSTEAEDLIKAANEKNVFLSVGLIERFNPVITALKERWDQLGKVSQIIIRRMGPYPERIDTGVILDLAVHDFDLIRFLSGSEMDCMSGLSTRLVHKEKEDSVICIGKTKNEILTTIIENWTTPTKIRDLTIHGEYGMFHVDLLMQDLTFYENNYASAKWREMSIFRGISEGNRVKYYIERQEPLKLELIAFLNGVEGKPSNSVSGMDGLLALRLAERLQNICKQNGKGL